MNAKSASSMDLLLQIPSQAVPLLYVLTGQVRIPWNPYQIHLNPLAQPVDFPYRSNTAPRSFIGFPILPATQARLFRESVRISTAS